MFLKRSQIVICETFQYTVESAVTLLSVIAVSKHKFICSECGKEFYPKWYQVMFESHFFEHHRIKCPHCGKRKFNKMID